jgi:hypothetical protein
MEFWNTSSDFGQTEVTPVAGMPQEVASVSMFNYLGGSAILLILVGTIGVAVRAFVLKSKSRKAQIEMLERMWNKTPEKIEDNPY